MANTKEEYEELGSSFLAQMMVYRDQRIENMHEIIVIKDQHIELLEKRIKELESKSGYQYVTSSTEINTNTHEQE